MIDYFKLHKDDLVDTLCAKEDVPDLTPKQQLAFLAAARNMCYSNMEGCNPEEFIRWENLFVAYSTIVDDMIKEMREEYEESKNKEG